jgi:hypothetical protein
VGVARPTTEPAAEPGAEPGTEGRAPTPSASAASGTLQRWKSANRDIRVWHFVVENGY